MTATATDSAPSLHRRNPAEVTIRYAILIFAAIYFVGPVLWLSLAASKSSSAVFNTPAWSFEGFQLLTNLRDLFAYDGGIYLRWGLNSALYSILGALCGTFIASLAGYYISRYNFRGKEALFSIVLGGVLVPSTALALPLFLMFAQLDLTDSFWAVFLPSIVNPFSFYLCRLTADASVPAELVEAARVDGAGDFRIFFTIASRLMVPGLVTVFLVQFVGIWNNFLLPVIMLHDQSLYPITLGLYQWSGQISLAPELQTLVLVGSLVSVAPLIIAFIALQRFWQSGLGAGAVKA